MRQMSMNVTISIGDIARETGLTVPTIRYYEEVGLIPPAGRRPSGHRHYGHEHFDAIGQVKAMRTLGFPLERIRQLQEAAGRGRPGCADVRTIAGDQLQEVRARLTELRSFERSLSAIVETCSATCPCGPAKNCSIVRDIASPAGSSSAAG